MQIRAYEPADEQVLVDLWAQVLPDTAPYNEPRVSLENKEKTGGGLLLVADLDGQIVGPVMGGYDGHRGRVYSLAVLPQARRRGIGTALCRKLEQMLQDRGCLKLNLQVRSDHNEAIAFQKRLGYTIEQRASLGKRLYD